MKHIPSTTALPHSPTANGERRTENVPDERGRRSAFTLIEMLVVVVVIAILSGLVFRMVGAGGTGSDKAQARRKLEALANAIEEYRAEYGRYPPVARVPDNNPKVHQPDYKSSWSSEERARKTYQPLRYEYPPNTDRWTGGNPHSLATTLKRVPRTEATVFQFGLLSYLVTRVEGRAERAPKELFAKSSTISIEDDHWLSQNSSKNSNINDRTLRNWINNGKISRNSAWDPDKNCCAVDDPRDVRAAKKIWPLLQGIVRTDECPETFRNFVYTNHQFTVWDPWGNQLNYRSDPPYESYRIWSIGPDCVSGTADDIVAGREN